MLVKGGMPVYITKRGSKARISPSDLTVVLLCFKFQEVGVVITTLRKTKTVGFILLDKFCEFKGALVFHLWP